MVPDILVIGAGAFGLSVAHAAHRAGLTVSVLEADAPGAGASGGVVGTLAPHAPSRWRPMMAFQFAALRSLETRARELHDRTGVDTGYRRTGRAVPIATERALERAWSDAVAAADVWGSAGAMSVRPASDMPWLAPDVARCGVLHDDITARIAPRAYLGALVASLPPDTVSRARATALAPGPRVETDGGTLSAGAIVCAAGWQGRDLLPPGLRGGGVKGQAALVRLSIPDLPVVTHEGLYIVPHGDGTVAVGSTSEKTWTSAGTDGQLDDLLARAANVIPALAGAEVLERWAGIRPRPPGREPLVGPIPGWPGVWVAGGGYRIGLGIAHAVGDAVVAMIRGETPPIPLPDSFLPPAG